jgi:hypothetical protein
MLFQFRHPHYRLSPTDVVVTVWKVGANRNWVYVWSTACVCTVGCSWNWVYVWSPACVCTVGCSWNWVYVWSTAYVCTVGCSWNWNSWHNTLETDRPQHDFLAVIAQQYSSINSVSLPFHSLHKKIDPHFNPFFTSVSLKSRNLKLRSWQCVGIHRCVHTEWLNVVHELRPVYRKCNINITLQSTYGSQIIWLFVYVWWILIWNFSSTFNYQTDWHLKVVFPAWTRCIVDIDRTYSVCGGGERGTFRKNRATNLK